MSGLIAAITGASAATLLGVGGLALTAASDFGLFGSKGPGAPAAPPPLPPSASPASLASVVSQQQQSNSVKGAIGAGFDNTISTSPLGDTSKTNTAQAGLLGGS